MSRFVQLHILTSYPPSNLNRDDLGRPKTAVMGGAPRLRVSSQSLKRAWRTSDVFHSALGGNLGTRTKERGRLVYKALVDGGIAEKKAKGWAQEIAKQFGALKKASKDDELLDLEIEQLAHFNLEEAAAIDSLVTKLIETGEAPAEDDLKLLRKNRAAADIALFGRMLAANPGFNCEAACQVAHALTVHKVQVEDDFFTAVDDLNDGSEDAGAGHMGETEFGAGIFYLYVCIDRLQLKDNLGGDDALTETTLSALVNAATTVSPTGKQNSFASRARASFVLAEKGDQQPRSLSVAFVRPVMGQNMLVDAIGLLSGKAEMMDQVYGDCADQRYTLDAENGSGTLAELAAFVSS